MGKLRLCVVRRNSGDGGAEKVAERFATIFSEEYEVSRMWAGGMFKGQRITGSRGEAWWRSWRYTRQLDSWNLKKDHIVFSMEYGPDCDIYRAGDGVHRLNVLRRYGSNKRWMLNPWHWLAPKLERKCLESATYVVANSALVASLLSREYPYLTRKIKIIHNGYDPLLYSPSRVPKSALRQQLGLPVQGKMLLLSGSGFRRKGLHHAIELLHRLRRAKIPAYLVVVGKGDPRYVGPMIEKYRLQDAVRFCGLVPRTVEYYQAADFMVLPTRHDPFSNSCLEALACGCPVLTSSENGAAEVLNNRTGFVFQGRYDDKEYSACEEFIRRFDLTSEEVSATVAEKTSRHEIEQYKVLVKAVAREKWSLNEAFV